MKKVNRDQVLPVRLTTTERRLFDQAAAASGMTVTTLIRSAAVAKARRLLAAEQPQDVKPKRKPKGLDTTQATITGNVPLVTHGEAVPDSLLGDGPVDPNDLSDAQKPFMDVLERCGWSRLKQSIIAPCPKCGKPRATVKIVSDGSFKCWVCKWSGASVEEFKRV